MKITNISAAYDIYKSKPAISGKKTETGKKKDNLKVSDQARDFQLVYKAVVNSSDIREDRITDLKSKIDNGAYKVDTESIADKILSRLS